MAEARLTAEGCAARVYGRLWRAAAALLVAVRRASLPLLLVLVVLATDPPIDLPLLLELLVVLAMMPGLAAALMRRATAARIELGDAAVIIRRADLVVEVPYGAIARVAPWALPLPAPGLTLWMRSGRRLRYAIEIDDPAPLLAALAPRVAAAYARTFAVYWLTLAIYLVLFASLWRGAAEIAALLSSHVAPAHAVRVRRIAERGCQVLYYGGVPALVAARFLT